MKINKRREEFKESVRDAKRTLRKMIRIKKYGLKGKKKNEIDRENRREKDITCNYSCRRIVGS